MRTTLPYSQELAGWYSVLDLPFGADMDEVTSRWKEYLKKCHPDLHAKSPELYDDANKLTKIITEAHDKIREAWERHQKWG